MSTKVTMTDTAYHCMSKRKREVDFNRLWADVAKTMKIPENQMLRKKAAFYSQLMLDPRFAALTGNKWDLRNRRSFNELHAEEVLDDIDDDEEDEEIVDDETLDLPKGEDEY